MVTRKELGSGEIEIEVKGNLNADTVGEFRDALHGELASSHSMVLLNLEKVRAMNSAALGALLLFRKRAMERGKRIRIEKCSDDLKKTLLAIRFDRMMEMPE